MKASSSQVPLRRIRGSVRELGGSKSTASSTVTAPASVAEEIDSNRETLDTPQSFSALTSEPKQAIAESRRIIEAARHEATELITQAKHRIERDREAAHRQGLEEGQAEGLGKVLEIITTSATGLEGNEQQILDLVFAVSEEVIGAALKVQPESIVPRIERAMQHLVQQEHITLVVHSTDLLHVKRQLNQLAASAPQVSQIITREDDRIEPGNAKLETATTVIEASVPAHLAALRSHFELHES